MILVIIAEQGTERHILEEAFKHLPIETKIFDSITKIDKSCENNFILAILSQSNEADLIALTDKNSVFIISDTNIEKDKGFENIFLRPIRLGNIIENIEQTIKQDTIHKSLSPIQLGTITLNPQTSHIIYKEKTARLTEKELALLIFLSQNINRGISRQELLDTIWGYSANIETHTLETHIYRLRQKLQTQLTLDNFLLTNKNGYVLNF